MVSIEGGTSKSTLLTAEARKSNKRKRGVRISELFLAEYESEQGGGGDIDGRVRAGNDIKRVRVMLRVTERSRKATIILSSPVYDIEK
ncbi:hypothetical protein EVAR_46039_1 [Eumeta japonica]|uniref:Uncharacterized protein n=1 Tax=Eumeta variegata TaxID=151549 RepID=A0A4C1XFY2_EUMVA|nr:hypothetical protein EVAR_46039_1 [Eumeta japonica]